MMGLRRWIVAVGALFFVAVLHSQPVSFTDLAKHPEYQNVKISPDGKYLAATAVVNSQTVLALIPLADMKKGHVIRPQAADDVADFWWVSPTRVVYTVGMTMGGYDRPVLTGQLLGIDADGSNPKILGFAEFVASIPDDTDHMLVAIPSKDSANSDKASALVSYRPWVAFRMDVHNGGQTRITMAPGNINRFIADHHGHIRFAYGTDVSGKIRVFEHPIDSDNWHELSKVEQQNDSSSALVDTLN